MNENKDLEKYFEKEAPLPDSLSKENVVKMLKDKNVKQKKKKHILRKIVAVAACAAIVTTGAVRISNIKKPVNYVGEQFPNPPPVSSEENGAEKKYEKIDIGLSPKKLTTFASDEDLKNYFMNKAKDNSNRKFNNLADDFVDGVFGGFYAKTEDALADEEFFYATNQAMGAPASTITTGTADGSDLKHSETNTQTTGVDEADIIKNDGRYLYIVSEGNTLTIVDTESMTAVFSKELEAKDKEKTFRISELYLNGNKLIVTGREYKEIKDEKLVDSGYRYSVYDGIYSYSYEDEKAVSAVYDITDKANPVLFNYVTQDGYLNNSRMIGTVMYMVTTYNVKVYSKEETAKKYAPTVNGEAITCDCIFVASEEDDSTNYVVVSAFDTARSDSEVNSASFLGYHNEVYCSTTTLYVVNTDWEAENEGNPGKQLTNIHAFSLDGTKVEYKGSGVVPGSIDNQYSLDEYNGFLRVATTGYNYNTDEDTSNLYVLDSSLNVIGQLSDIAKDEQIKSVRYMGQYGYVVTFRNTDPLFVIDFADPSKPEIKGEVKLPGFSEYLHPVGNGMLVGIGYDGDEENANFQSVKISLFDVKDPANPLEIDNHIIKNASTDVNYDPKAFLYYPEENTIGIPLQYDLVDGNNNYHGVSYQYKLMSIEDGKFTEKLNFAHPNDESGWYNFFRGAYIGKTLYTITDLSVAQFDMENGNRMGFVEFADRDEEMYRLYK